jgi:lipopolysaccharide transport system permease protein
MMLMGFDQADLKFILNLWKINISDRYLGSILGGVWAIMNPLLMFTLFTFVFGYVFKARLPGADTTMAYSIWLIAGYGPWMANTEALTSAANSIIGNAGLVKNVSFKTEALPIAATMLGLIPLAVSIIFLLLLQLFSGDGLHWTVVWLPLLVSIQFLFLSALGVLLAAITTFVRDLGILLPNLLMIVLFATPIFYPVEALPSYASKLMEFNPIYIIATSYRNILLDGQVGPSIIPMLTIAVFSLGFLYFSLGLFRRVKVYFSAVI